MTQQKRRKFDFIVAIKYLFIFIFVVAHFQMLRGTAEVIPVLIPSLSEQVNASIVQKYSRTRRSSNSTSRYSNHTSISYYLEASFYVNELKYNNTDLVSEGIYNQVKIGHQIKIHYLKSFPQVALFEINKSYAIKNHFTLASILLGIDIIVWLIWKWIKNFRNKNKKAT